MKTDTSLFTHLVSPASSLVAHEPFTSIFSNNQQYKNRTVERLPAEMMVVFSRPPRIAPPLESTCPLVLWSNQVPGCGGGSRVRRLVHSTSAISTSPFTAADFLFLLFLVAGASSVFLAGAAGAWTEETGVQMKPLSKCSGEVLLRCSGEAPPPARVPLTSQVS